MPRPQRRKARDESRGVIGRTVGESKPLKALEDRAPEGAPNVVYIVLSDVGFGHLDCFGGLGGIVDTPNTTRLAASGLRYTDFHTPGFPSAARSCLLAGRNHHSNGMGAFLAGATPFPGYTGRIPSGNGLLPEVLLDLGYNTFGVGEWHLAPAEEQSAAGPYCRWPLGKGIERFYGFLGGESSQWYPSLVYDNHPVDPPRSPEQGYHLAGDLTDKAIRFIREQRSAAPDKPFFLLYAPGACHVPHHVPSEWIDKYRGRFDRGWDLVREQNLARQKRLGVVPLDTELPPRPDWIPAWDHLSPDEQTLYARMMEVFAGYLSYADHQIGRLTDVLVKTGDIASTLFFVVSDNGASAEGGLAGSFDQSRWLNGSPEGLEENLSRLDLLGGPGSYNHYPAGWAMAGNTPLRGFKGDVLEGGTKVPLIVCWQRGIRSRGEVRRQYVHAIDIMPTVLSVLGVAAPEEINGVRQSALEGISFAYSFSAPEEPTRREVQYFEMLGRRAIWHKDWKAVADHRPDSGQDFIHDRWELYHLVGDASECRDLAASYPDELRELIERWWVEASRHNVLPLDDRLVGRLAERRPRLARPRSIYTYYPNTSEVHASAAAPTLGGSLTITAELEVPVGGAEGVLFAQGSQRGGHCLFVKDQRPVYVHSYIDGEEYAVTADRDTPLPPGRVVVRLRLTRTGRGEGLGVLYVNGVNVGEGMIEQITPLTFSATGSGIRIGRDSAPGVSHRYEPPFTFTGGIEKVVVEVRGEQAWDGEAEARTILARG